ncbi:MAG TPA: SUKH-3 domain-containing protein [Pirellulales bacterium]
MNFSRYLSRHLAAHGWSPERSVDETQWTAPLIAEGRWFSAESIAILKNLGGLTIPPYLSRDHAYMPTAVTFDPCFLLDEGHRVELWEAALKRRLSPLGFGADASSLLIAEDGGVFVCFERLISDCGGPFEDALEASLIAARRCPPLYKIDAAGKLIRVRER